MSVCHAHLLSRSGLRCMSQTGFYYIYLSFIIIIIIIIITFSDVKPVAQISVRSSCLENVQTLYVDMWQKRQKIDAQRSGTNGAYWLTSGVNFSFRLILLSPV